MYLIGFCFTSKTISLCQNIRNYLNILAKLTPFFELNQIEKTCTNIFETLNSIYENK